MSSTTRRPSRRCITRWPARGGDWEGPRFSRRSLLYWLRFLNLFFVGALVWLGYITARLVFPEREFLRLGVPALLAFVPQSAFYSIQNDVLSPLAFGAAFICLVKLLRADIPGVRLGMITVWRSRRRS